MAKETEERLIKALEFLKEPHGSTISTIVKAMNGDGPQVSLKKIVQTLRGCLQNGTMKVSDGRVKLKHIALSDGSSKENMSMDDRSKNLKPLSQGKSCGKATAKYLPKRSWKTKGQRSSMRQMIPTTTCDDEPPAPENGNGGGGCPPCPVCKKKPKPKCPKPKPKCPKPKPKCPKPKPKCPKPKPKCPPKKKKPKCPPKKPKKKCGKKIKIQPYCKKKKKCMI